MFIMFQGFRYVVDVVRLRWKMEAWPGAEVAWYVVMMKAGGLRGVEVIPTGV